MEKVIEALKSNSTRSVRIHVEYSSLSAELTDDFNQLDSPKLPNLKIYHNNLDKFMEEMKEDELIVMVFYNSDKPFPQVPDDIERRFRTLHKVFFQDNQNNYHLDAVAFITG